MIRFDQNTSRARGFTLVELMIAILLGILISVGLVALFGATSKTNRLQQAMAQIQENGRYAINRINNDLRLASRQMMHVGGYSAVPADATNGAINLVLAPQVYSAKVAFPDGDVTPPVGWDTAKALSWWPLSPSYFMQGYECSSATCASVPAQQVAKDDSVADQKRVQKSDVVTLRYFNQEGWSYYRGEVATNCAGGPVLNSVTLTPVTAAPNPSPVSNFQTGDLALLTSNGYSLVFEVNVVGNVLTPANILNLGTVPCIQTGSTQEVMLYNFSKDFITVTYWLKLVADPASTGRFIPSLMRTQHVIADKTPTFADGVELIQGVENLDFLYGVETTAGKTMFITANDVDAKSTTAICTPPPKQYIDNLPGVFEPNCLWRSIKTVEAHLLVDGVSNMYDLTNADMSFTYNDGFTNSTSYDGVATPPAKEVSGIDFGKMIRRPFVALVSIRNYNP